MAWDNVLWIALLTGLIGLAVLNALWPRARHGKRLLERWGVPDPGDAEVTLAVRYLKRRRIWYPWLFLVIPPALGDATAGTIVTTLILGGLIAELLAQRPSRGPRREAALARRTLLDLVPAWALALSGLATAGSLLSLGVAGRWSLLSVSAGAAIVSWAIALLALRRPADGEPRADLALRRRSARVAIGLGIATCAAISGPTQSLGSFLAVVAGMAAFLAVVAPIRRQPASA
ncbi:hypothetical protein [Amycolatopsis sp. SID8362]|uniref:hypothetical protein n=1 Tax=Amycolatopsis sp. SID8362 TaxID=2690346 RepID=UPI00136ECF31|nr:hypothetical protein [Amycolatopsis sp. SID8362]NBH12157.1 hypothetical protein [Amycolatopsis sp. SID8362]NED48849.1 hypothetical protein [Amycolatopsis sp. SID8362]